MPRHTFLPCWLVSLASILIGGPMNPSSSHADDTAAGPARTVALDQEIGANDFRISDMGGIGNPAFDGLSPDVAYNSVDDEYLVVWYGNDGSGGLTAGELEIFARRLAATGLAIGADFRISEMGGTGSGNFRATRPAVAYNSHDNEYLVVWQGTHNASGLVFNESEIFGQRIDGDTGSEIGVDFRISETGGTGNTAFGAFDADVAYNSQDNEYLVVWHADDNSGGLVDEEFEIHGQRIDGATGARIGADFRISEMGGTGDPAFDALFPAVAYNSFGNEYLVVWYGDDNSGGLVDGESEVHGQRIDAATGAQIGAQFRISDMGPPGDPDFEAFEPAVAYNSAENEYLVVWRGDDGSGGQVDNEFEVFGQRLDAATSAPIGADFRLSEMGPEGNDGFDALEPAVSYDAIANEYLVVWQGEDDSVGAVVDEFEIFGQRIDGATGVEIGNNDVRLSDMGGTALPAFVARVPAVAYNTTRREWLVVWEGTDNKVGLVQDEFEIFGQRLARSALVLFEDDLEAGLGFFSIDNTFGTGNGRWHLTSGCQALTPGHSSPSALYYGNTASCVYLVDDEEGVVTSGTIDLPELALIELRFSYWLFTRASGTNALVEISQDGGPFQHAASNVAGQLYDPSGSWETAVVDLSSRAGSAVRVRWHVRGAFLGGSPADGFYVDDVEIITTEIPPMPGPIFADGFESGDTSAWSSSVGE